MTGALFEFVLSFRGLNPSCSVKKHMMDKKSLEPPTPAVVTRLPQPMTFVDSYCRALCTRSYREPTEIVVLAAESTVGAIPIIMICQYDGPIALLEL